MSLKTSLIYFMIGNNYYHKEICNYINEYNNTIFSQSDLDEIISTSTKIFTNISETQKNTKNSEIFENFKYYYILTNTDTFYLSAFEKDSNIDEDDIFQLIEDIESQGIKKLTDKNGELSKIGKQNLKFCIEQNKKNSKKNNSILDFFKLNNNNNSNKEQDSNTISLLNDVHNEIKDDGRKKLINSNEHDNDDIINFDKKDKNEINLNNESQSDRLQKRNKCRRITLLIVCFCFVMSLFIVPIIILKKK